MTQYRKLLSTHLNQRRDYRAVQEAFEKQQIRVVGHLAQFLQVVAYVHEGGWNSDQALFHNTVLPRRARRATTLPARASSWGCKRATRGGAGCGHSPDQYWDTATGGWSTRHFVGNGGDGFLNINFTMENSLDDRKFFVYRFVKITRRNKKLCNKKEEEKKLWSKILIYVQIDICRINELVDRNSGNVSLKIWIIIRYYECNFTPRSYYVLPSYI